MPSLFSRQGRSNKYLSAQSCFQSQYMFPKIHPNSSKFIKIYLKIRMGKLLCLLFVQKMLPWCVPLYWKKSTFSNLTRFCRKKNCIQIENPKHLATHKKSYLLKFRNILTSGSWVLLIQDLGWAKPGRDKSQYT